MIKIFNLEWKEAYKKIPVNSVNLIITSPPYNLGVRSKEHKKYKGTIIIDSYKDNEIEIIYQNQQIDFLNKSYNLLKEDGSMFYNHQNRFKKGKMSSPLEWILKSKFILKNEIIWNKNSGVDWNRNKFVDNTEKIFWLTKTSKSASLESGAQKFTSIWDIKGTRRYDNFHHKATFPIDLIVRILNSLDIRKDCVILDPYAGTGTVGIAAKLLKFENVILIEKLKEWCTVIEKRIEAMPFLYNNYKIEEIPTIDNKYRPLEEEQLNLFNK